MATTSSVQTYRGPVLVNDMQTPTLPPQKKVQIEFFYPKICTIYIYKNNLIFFHLTKFLFGVSGEDLANLIQKR